MLIGPVVTPFDVPICLPGRSCVDEPPVAGPLVGLMIPLGPISSAIAAACCVVLGAALVLVGLGLRSQWRGDGVRRWFVGPVTSLLLVGAVLASVVDAWSGTVSTIYGGADGGPPARVPAALTASWSSVLAGADAMVVLAAVALFAALHIAVVGRRRSALP